MFGSEKNNNRQGKPSELGKAWINHPRSTADEINLFENMSVFEVYSVDMNFNHLAFLIFY